MIQLPICYFCENFNSEKKNCPAYPDGIPLKEYVANPNKECPNGYEYKTNPELL